MNEEERRAYAEELIFSHATDIEYMTIHEMAEESLPNGTISDKDALAVDKLIRHAVITISWPDVGAQK